VPASVDASTAGNDTRSDIASSLHRTDSRYARRTPIADLHHASGIFVDCQASIRQVSPDFLYTAR
jgi:hypothetical protein